MVTKAGLTVFPDNVHLYAKS